MKVLCFSICCTLAIFLFCTASVFASGQPGEICVEVFLNGHWDGVEYRPSVVDILLEDETGFLLPPIEDVVLDEFGIACMDMTSNGILDGTYFIGISHYNHLDLLSSFQYFFNNNLINPTPRFSNPPNVACQDDALMLEGNIWTMPAGDASGDGVVNIFDYALMGTQWNTSGPESDYNADGVVNLFDYALLGQNWSRNACSQFGGTDDIGVTCDGCYIGSVCYGNGQLNPTNSCQVCLDTDPTVWSDNDGYSCDDNVFCNGTDLCNAGDCLDHSGTPCPDDGEFCNGSEGCDEVNDQCVTSGIPDCDDLVGCTDDSCDETNDACVNAVNDANCDDGAWCNGSETCDSVNDCVAGTDPCDPATHTCDEINDECDPLADDDDDDDTADDDDDDTADDDDDDTSDDDDDDTVLVQTDWQPQDFHNSQGIYEVYWNAGDIVLETNLLRGDLHISKGEAYTDLRYYYGLDCEVPLDMVGQTITIDVDVPSFFFPGDSIGLQVFVKDAEWLNEYGTWLTVNAGGSHTVSLAPSTVTPPYGYMDPGFDPSKIILLGLKVAANTGFSVVHQGNFVITQVSVTPPITIPPKPPLPTNTPTPIFAPGDIISWDSSGFLLNSQAWFIVGGNWLILEYDQKFGVTGWYPWGNGVSRHPIFVADWLDVLRRSGVKVLRVGLVDSGTALLDQVGNVIGYNNRFRSDVETLLDLAEAAGIKIEFTVVDFLLAFQEVQINNVWTRGREEVLTLATTRQDFIDNFLIPFLVDFGGHDAFFGVDCINECEWLISVNEGGGYEWWDDEDVVQGPKIPLADVQAYISACADAVHTYAPGKPVTAGVSAEYIHLVDLPNLDYFALHHYGWMNGLDTYLPQLPVNVPWSLEEFPSLSATTSLSDYMDLSLSLGGAGGMMWNITPDLDDATYSCGDRDSIFVEMRTWVDAI